MGNVTVETVADFGSGQGVGFMVRTHEMFVALSGLVNVAEEIAKLEKDLAYQQKFLAGVRGKLANERFVANAPAAVIENERKKEADSLSKIESLESQLKALKNS
jgi:valyl-tRNA synthetase